jgi:glycosyltransferase involved in cell wall biosynthesis
LLPKIRKPILEIIDYFFKLRKFSIENNLNNYDVIYIQSLEFGLLNFSKIKVPVYYFSRSTIIGIVDCYRRYGIKLNFTKRLVNKILIILEKMVLRHCQKVFVKSGLMARELSEFYDVENTKIDVITGGIDKKDFNDEFSEDQLDGLRKKYGIASGEKVFVYAGRIVPQKGLSYLIEALEVLGDESDFRLLVAGSVVNLGYYSSILNLLNKNKLNDKVLFIGHIDQFEMNMVLGVAAGVISPSLYEPFGMINIQAAVLKKVIITTTAVGSNEILKGYEKMIVVNPGSAAELAEAIKSVKPLYDMKSEKDFYNYSWKKVSDKLLSIFQKSLH